MAAHPLIGFREVSGEREPYVLGTQLAVWEVMELVRASGSVDAAAAVTGIAPELLAAGVAYFNEAGAGAQAVPKSERDGERASPLQLVTQAFGLFAGLTTIVYLAGGVVLALRLAFEELPWEPVIGQLPREFVLSTGAGQVLLPALVVGGLYGLFRLLRWERSSPPAALRWRDGGWRRLTVVLGYAVMAAAMLLPGAAVVVIRELTEGGRDPDMTWLFAGFGVLLLPAIALYELRALLGSKYRMRWNTPLLVAGMAGVYIVLTMPAFMAAGAAIPLNEAKVCTSGDSEEHGALVGQAGDRVYIGEDAPDNRRIAVFPLSQIEELFVGGVASAADCDVGDARLAVIADERAAAAGQAARELDRMDPSTSGGRALNALGRQAENAVRNAGLAALETADAVELLRVEEELAAREAGNRALDARERFGMALTAAAPGPVRDAIDRARRAAHRAAETARAAADAARLEARRRQPAP